MGRKSGQVLNNRDKTLSSGILITTYPVQYNVYHAHDYSAQRSMQYAITFRHLTHGRGWAITAEEFKR